MAQEVAFSTDRPEFGPIEYGGEIYLRWVKRPFDVLASLVSLIVLSPALLICCLLVGLTSRGPVLFRQIRLGRYARPFKVLKFRTLKRGAEELGSRLVVPGDERQTGVGGLLRRTKLDELPQLVNVLLGEMSLVGPRPRVPEEVDLGIPQERALLTLRPGLTSYASLYHHTEAEYCSRKDDPRAVHREDILPQKTYLDGEYLKNLSFFLDMKLILLTFVLVFVPGTAKPRVARIFGLEVPSYSRMAQILLEASIYAASIWLAYWLRYEGELPPSYHLQRAVFVVLLPLARVASNQIFGIYKMIWRYANLYDLALLSLSLGAVSAILFLLRAFLPSEIHTANVFQLPVTVIAMEYLLSLGGCAGLRGLRRALYEMSHRYRPLPSGRKRRLLIIGAGLSGMGVALEVERHPHLEVVGFLDDDPAKLGRVIAGYSVLGPCGMAVDLVRRHEISDVIVTVQSWSNEQTPELLKHGSVAGANIHLTPTLDQILGPEAGEAEAHHRSRQDSPKTGVS